MPPKKRVAKAKLHELAPEVSTGTKFSDHRKREFVVGKQFATGGFGRIYTCKESGHSEQLVVKIEPAGNGPLFTEVNVFQRILKPEQINAFLKERKLKGVGVPTLISSGVLEYKDEKLRYLVMPHYYTSLESIREKEGGKLDVKSTFALAKAMLHSLEYIHSANYTHGDIKAGNILLRSAGDFSNAVLVDFGLARLASSNEEKAEKKRAHNGTALFTSLDAHSGLQPSYRGDIEILFYNIVYWITGTLPWVKVEDNPVAVQAGKEELKKNVDSFLRKNLPSLALPLSSFYSLATSTPYTSGVDFNKLHEMVKKAVASSSKDTVSTPAKAVKKTVSAKKEVESKDEEEDSKQIKKAVSAKKAVAVKNEEKDDKDAVRTVKTRSGRGEDEMEVEEGRRKRVAAPKTVPSAKRPTPPSPASQSSDSTDDENYSNGVDSSVKADPTELRRAVPGMRNLPKHRRSMLINRIAAKHSK